MKKLNATLRVFVFVMTILMAEIASACTIGLALPEATVDGRPIIFKNRDITNWSLEFKHMSFAGCYSYCGNKYISSGNVWMGVNEVGLGIVQSAAYNLSSSGSGLSNGSLIDYGLMHCETVAEFEAILDSTDATGRSTAANYAVIDAYGNGAIFECSPSTHARYDPDESGIITRGNFSYIGDSGRRGLERMIRSDSLMHYAYDVDSLTPEFIGLRVVNDLYRMGNDPYPLPFTGSFPGVEEGWICTDSSNYESINNEQTLACGVIQGVAPGEDQSLSCMYCYFGPPALSAPFVMFPITETEPPYCLYPGNEFRDLSRDNYYEAFHHSYEHSWLDASILLDSYGDGLWTHVIPNTEWVYRYIADKREEWGSTVPSVSELIALQDSIAEAIFYLSSHDFALGMDSEEIDLPETKDLLAFPNPFNSVCYFDDNKSELEIYDIEGKLVHIVKEDESSWKPESKISSGAYLIFDREKNTIYKEKVLYIK